LQVGVTVQILTLTPQEHYEQAIRALGLDPVWIGRRANPLLRLSELTLLMRRFRPHILQSSHFFTNLYAALAARICGAMSVGSIRNDVLYEVEANGRWGPGLLRTPSAMIANSETARRNAEGCGIPAAAVHVLQNVIDLVEFDRASGSLAGGHPSPRTGPVALVVGRLVAAKRFDRFLTALARARSQVGDLRGMVAGDGPERSRLEQQARELSLIPDGVEFLGRRDDVPTLLRGASMLVVSSDHEGFPNVLLEAMAARLPIITTAAGDAAEIVRSGECGYVVPFTDTEAMADCMSTLAKSLPLRRQLGESGRRHVESRYGFDSLAERLLSIYRSMAEIQKRRSLLPILVQGTR
jgi:glycosyltransferase involved in cell wall biosynthesis